MSVIGDAAGRRQERGGLARDQGRESALEPRRVRFVLRAESRAPTDDEHPFILEEHSYE
jgi:hypothetical protein